MPAPKREKNCAASSSLEVVAHQVETGDGVERSGQRRRSGEDRRRGVEAVEWNLSRSEHANSIELMG